MSAPLRPGDHRNDTSPRVGVPREGDEVASGRTEESRPGTQGSAGAGPVVVASNRLPFTIERKERKGGTSPQAVPSAGGLITALEPVLRDRGGTWVGWPGAGLQPGEELPSADEAYRVAPVHLRQEEIDHYLHGFCNRTLWPLFHSLSMMARYDREDFEHYERVNATFAEAIVNESRAGDLIWVHDYHLMLAPNGIRRALPEARLAFFLHIPFPPYDLFRLLPWDRELLRGLLACDLIGFHVPNYANNFLDCVERRLGTRVDREAMVVEYGDRAVQIGAFPIGIDFADFEARALQAPPQPETARERLIVGVDRLDYTKGIIERINAFERLLELHPEHRERVVLLQVAVPSRSEVAEYRNLKAQIDGLVGSVNGRFATASWSPIRYLVRSVSPERLAALYRDAEVALITPLRDGMNLVAKEFVASQVAEPGVLVLSRLAGAAETMREAILVNPHDTDGTAAALHRALTMDEPERRSRMAALRKREQRDDVHAWVRSFLGTAATTSVAPRPLSSEDFQAWLGAYLTRPHLELFLDYDGTLTPLRSHPSEAVLSDSMRSAMETCAVREDSKVAIISGRALSDIQELVGHRQLTYAGNHGLEISGTDIPDFQHEDLVHYRSRVEDLARALEEVSGEGAWTEVKGPTLTYHYRQVLPDRRVTLIERARAIITTAGFQARDAHAALEARPPIGWDKGRAVLHILRARYGPSWSDRARVVYVGDDQTDEDAFRFLSGLAMTFRVGPSDTLTSATYRLPDVNAVQALLEWLGKRPRAESSRAARA
ncbi:MAG: bifunctional alpha,alpha-trehalose-phosphate synthase (UDP-forming)/trehalose-phosphatase [Myxococcota bacterium]